MGDGRRVRQDHVYGEADPLATPKLAVTVFNIWVKKSSKKIERVGSIALSMILDFGEGATSLEKCTIIFTFGVPMSEILFI